MKAPSRHESNSILDFSKSLPRDEFTTYRKATNSTTESIPIDSILYRDTIQVRAKMGKGSSVVSMDKQIQRDDAMYRQNMQKKNIELENQREERLKQIEDRKKNRHKYR